MARASKGDLPVGESEKFFQNGLDFPRKSPIARETLSTEILARAQRANPRIHGVWTMPEKWIPGLRLPRKIASLFCRDGASRK
jgi:hypothetical protein